MQCGKCGKPVEQDRPTPVERVSTHLSLCSSVDNHALCLHPLQDAVPGRLSLQEIKDVMENALTSFPRDRLCRNCEHLCDIHNQKLGDMEREFKNLGSKKDILSLLCDRVGTMDITPLMSLMDLFQPAGNERQVIMRCKETLLTHQKRSELSVCVECTSPPRTPVYQYLRPSFLFIASRLGGTNSPKSSPSSSPVSPGALTLLPSTILQQYGYGVEVQPIQESC